jgi:hypothetical protein
VAEALGLSMPGQKGESEAHLAVLVDDGHLVETSRRMPNGRNVICYALGAGADADDAELERGLSPQVVISDAI